MRSRQPSRILLPFLFTTSSLSLPQAASAEVEKKADTYIPEIIVQSQKREQNIDDISISVTSIAPVVLENMHLKDTTQIASLVPNVKMTGNAGEGTPPAFNIRGIGMIDYNTSTISPIAIYNDGVVGGSANNLSVNMFDMEAIEVLRGPQGTLFGRNTTGGAILLRSKMPEKDLGGYIAGSAAERSQYNVNGAINLPLTNNTAARLAFGYDDYNYSTNNLHPGSPDGGLEQLNLRLTVRSELENLTVTAKVHLEDWQGSPKPSMQLGIWDDLTNGVLCDPEDVFYGSGCVTNFGVDLRGDDYWDVNSDTFDRRHETDSWGAMLNLQWQISENMILTSITGYKELDRFHSWDSDGPTDLLEGSMGTNNDLFSQELSLSIQGDRYYWIAGLYYLEEDITQENDIDIFRDFRGIIPVGPAQIFYHNTLENKAKAVYSQIDYDLTEQLTITAGLRYTDEETNYVAVADLDTADFFLPGLWDLSGTQADEEVSGKIALVYQATEQSSFYASFTRGFKSGGYNAGYSTSPEQAAASAYAPEHLNAYEIGSRFSLMDDHIRMSLAGFYYDYQDQQIFVNRTTGIAPFHVLRNAGSTEIFGLEGEILYRPTERFQMNLNVGWLPEADTGEFSEEGSLPVIGNRLPFASKWNVSGYAQMDYPLSGGTVVTQAGFDYQSGFYFDQNENPYTFQEGFTLFHARLAWRSDQGWELGVFGKNLANEKYSELRFDSTAALGSITELKGEKQQFGVDLRFDF